MDDVLGCGEELEGQLRGQFYRVIEGLMSKMRSTNNETELRVLVNALKWQFSASDHEQLVRVNLFKLLREGTG